MCCRTTEFKGRFGAKNIWRLISALSIRTVSSDCLGTIPSAARIISLESTESRPTTSPFLSRSQITASSNPDKSDSIIITLYPKPKIPLHMQRSKNRPSFRIQHLRKRPQHLHEVAVLVIDRINVLNHSISNHSLLYQGLFNLHPKSSDHHKRDHS